MGSPNRLGVGAPARVGLPPPPPDSPLGPSSGCVRELVRLGFIVELVRLGYVWESSRSATACQVGALRHLRYTVGPSLPTLPTQQLAVLVVYLISSSSSTAHRDRRLLGSLAAAAQLIVY